MPTWIQVKGLKLKYLGESCLFKLVEQIGKPLQVDESTKNRDKMLFSRIMLDVKLGQDFPTTLEFINEFDEQVELEIFYEWLPYKCTQCNGIGHEVGVFRNKAMKQEWVPKKPQPEKVKIVDEEGFEVVKKGTFSVTKGAFVPQTRPSKCGIITGVETEISISAWRFDRPTR